MEDIQSWWELPSIAHFCSLFRAAFDLLDFDIEELEEAILTDGLDRSGSPLLVELLMRLLQGCLPGKNITPSNVDSYLRKLFRQKCQEDPTKQNLFMEGEFRHLPLRKKVEVLHALCDFRLEAEDVLDLLKNLETESLRVEPLGYDDRGSTFWYFYGTRLYREDNSLYHPFRRRPKEKEKEDKRKKKRKKKGVKDSSADEEESLLKPTWQVQCYTEEDWCKLSKQFEDCESKLEKSLLQTLQDDFLPEIPRLFEEKEKIQQKRMMEFAPRRSSGRVQKLKEKKEEEEKRLAVEIAIQEKKRIQEEEKRRLQEEEEVGKTNEEMMEGEVKLSEEFIHNKNLSDEILFKEIKKKKRESFTSEERLDLKNEDDFSGAEESKNTIVNERNKTKEEVRKKHNSRDMSEERMDKKVESEFPIKEVLKKKSSEERNKLKEIKKKKKDRESSSLFEEKMDNDEGEIENTPLEDETLNLQPKKRRKSRVSSLGEEKMESEDEVDYLLDAEAKKKSREDNVKIKNPIKKNKKNDKPDNLSAAKIDRHLDRDDDVLHERNSPHEPILKDEESLRHRHNHTHREKKPHHRKHHKRGHHKNNHHLHSMSEALSPDNHVVSDTSNKENHFGLESSENEEENVAQPQVYSGRKTNNSLSSLAFSLTPSSVVPEPTSQMVTSPPNKKRVKSAHMLLQTEDDLKTGMYKVLEHLREHEDAWPFLDPVDENFAPNYYAVIRRPMYITKMESRLDSGYYTILGMFEADFKLMMDNCKLYNGPESEYTHMAYTLEKVFAKLKTKYLETEFSSDEEIYIDLSFQQASKRKNKKRNSTDEKENKSAEESLDKLKKGKKKKKVGRKPKIKTLEEVVSEKVIDKRLKESSPIKTKEKPRGRKRKETAKEDELEEGHSKEKKTEIVHEDKHDLNEDEDDDDDDDDDDYNGPLLLVREDPYPEDDENEDSNDRLSPPPPVVENTDASNSSFSYPKSDCNIKEDFRAINKWKKDPDKSIINGLEDDDTYQEKVEIHSPKLKKEEKLKTSKSKINDKPIKKKYNKDKKIKKLKSKKRTKKGDSENNLEEVDGMNATKVSAMDISDSDSDHDGVLLYYNNDDGNSNSEDEKVKSRNKYLSERHNELFGEIDDIEEERESGDELESPNKVKGEGDKNHLHSPKKCKKKDKLESLKDKRKHKHHHHHHHKSKSKVIKNHHHKKTRNASGNESPSKKVLKVEEVYEYSEDDPNSRDSKDKEKDKEIPLSPPPIKEDKELKPILSEELITSHVTLEMVKDASQSKKKKNRRKGKHSKHIKHKEVKDKIKGDKKTSKRKCIKKIIKKKRQQIPVQKMAAIDALSAATEQTLKDITCLLDDPEVPRFKVDSPSISAPTDRVTAQEFESIALKIEAEYRRKLKLEPPDEKKCHKKKKRKIDDVVNEVEPKKKKIKKEKVTENKENDKKVEKDRERRNSETSSLDNIKELFKDIKDGRIKPGAIIKSKDIAKKEGVVKKETKPPSEPKAKSKQNPFGKINKQENSKLTTLIAKAKESRIGLVPNSELGDSPKLSLGSIIPCGNIGSGKHSSREPNSADDEDKISDKLPEKVEKWDSPWENRWEKPVETKEEISNPPSQATEEEEEKEEIDEIKEVSPERPVEEILPPPTPRAPEFRQERATPNLSAWFRAFGGPKLTAAPRKRMDDDERLEEDVEFYEDEENECKSKDENEEIDVEEHADDDAKEDKEEAEQEEIHVGSPDVQEEHVPSPRPPSNNSAEGPVSPQPPLSPEKPPETPWYDKLSNKTEEEPIWKNNKIEEEEDPYKFEEEELDRAREEAKKLEVERQRKASVSSSGLSDPSPLNIDSDRSPAAFSSEGERSPLTRSPAMKSPVTPGFGSAKQYSPVTEKSPSVPAYSPRYDTGLVKSYAGFEDKSKYQANGTLKVGFYQDMTDKTTQDQNETPKPMEQKIKESPIYSPTVPYVSPLYSNKDQNLIKQKSPGRYSSYYSSLDSSSLDKPKTPGYYSTSAPSTPSDRPSPAAPIAPSEEKPKAQYNYYNYDPTKSLTDQYKNTGGNTKPFYGNNETNSSRKNSANSPLNCNTPMPRALHSPAQINLQSKPVSVIEKPELQPPKKRQAMERAAHQHQLNILNEQAANCAPRLSSSWNEKRDHLEAERNILMPLRNPYTSHPLPADLANLSQIVSRIPEPVSEPTVIEKESMRMVHEPLHSQSVISKTVHPSLSESSVLTPSSIQEIHQNHALTSRTSDISQSIESSPISDLSHQNLLLSKSSSRLHPPPAAHQKILEGERPGSRNMPPPPHAGEKSHGYLHQKTMWSSSLPSSIPVSLSSLVSNATMASIALAGQKGLGSFPSEHLAQFGMDRAALASLAGHAAQGGSQLFPHELLQRNSSSQSPGNPPSMASPTGLAMQTQLNGTSNNGPSSSSNHSRSSSVSGVNVSASSGNGSMGSNSNNFDLGLGRSYASMMSASQSSPLFVRSDSSLNSGSLPRSLSGSPSHFLPQSPGLGPALSIPGSARTPTPAHQQALSQSNYPTIRDPRDPISQSHPSLQIPSLNSIACSQAQTLSHLNAASLASYSSRDSLALMNQGGRGPLVGVEPTPQQLYQQYLQRHQLAAQEELLLRSAGAHSQLHQSMMLQQGLMSAAAASYPSGYPHTLALRSGTYQSMNRPWM